MILTFFILSPVFVSLTPEVEPEMRTPLHNFDFAGSNGKLQNLGSKKEKKSKNPLKVFANLRQTLRRSKQDLSNANECHSPCPSITPTPENSKKRPFSLPAIRFTRSKSDLEPTDIKPKKKLTRAATIYNKSNSLLRKINETPGNNDYECRNILCKSHKEQLVDGLVYERLQIASEGVLPEMEYETVQEFSAHDIWNNGGRLAKIFKEKDEKSIVEEMITHLSAVCDYFEQSYNMKGFNALRSDIALQQNNFEKLLPDLKTYLNTLKSGNGENGSDNRKVKCPILTRAHCSLSNEINRQNKCFEPTVLEATAIKCADDSENTIDSKPILDQKRTTESLLYKPFDNLFPSYEMVYGYEKDKGYKQKTLVSTELYKVKFID